MKLEHKIAIAAPRERVWAILMDLTAAARCVPGARDIVSDGDGARGTLEVKVGPIKLGLQGRVALEARDDAAGTGRFRAEAADQRLGGAVRAIVDLAVTGDAPTMLVVSSDVVILGRIGELGQPVIARQADKVLAGFAENVARAAST